jgi:hypothetical protein
MADDRLAFNRLGHLRMQFSGKSHSGIAPSLWDSREENNVRAAMGEN